MSQRKSPHSFYIPVMGTGFTIDTPLLVAKYGISSVISLVDDVLIEQVHRYWCNHYNESYTSINDDDPNPRATRITNYLNFVEKIVDRQIIELRESKFAGNSEIEKYLEMLPNENELSKLYYQMENEVDLNRKLELQDRLRKQIVAGRIDVNIMTKLDVERPESHPNLSCGYSDAISALCGFANSNLGSSVVLSAGFNPKLYGYLTKFRDFFPDQNNELKKKICLKVSDYHSALVQGKYLAKKGIWVSEYRVESALNCGGHAFVNDGYLLGPILEEFKENREKLQIELHEIYSRALGGRDIHLIAPQDIVITAQGGVGTNLEHSLLINKYGLNGVGWGSPFLLVPEVTNVDDLTLQKLIAAKEDEIYLSTSSPLDVPFWNLKNSPSEERRVHRIMDKNPGSPCTKGYTRFNREFTTEPICMASKRYQQLKLKELNDSGLPKGQLEILKNHVLSKSCICHELGGGVLEKRNLDKNIAPAICPGPNIINFKKIFSLREMVDHIYGRCSVLASSKRPHFFIKELQLQIASLINEIKITSLGGPGRSQKKLAEVKNNLCAGIEYYRSITKDLIKEQQEIFLKSLDELRKEIDGIVLDRVSV